MNICDHFDKIPFPIYLFNPMSKEEFDKCKHRIPWPGPRGPQGFPGPPGPQGPKGDPGIDVKPLAEALYMALPDDEKRKPDVLWVVYPNGLY